MGQELFIPQGFGELAPQLRGVEVDNDLGESIIGGFAVLAYPGKVWTVKHKGVETKLKIDPDNPTSDTVQSVEVVIVKSAKNLSKLYYINGWVEGSTARPDCYSSNGIIPDPGVAEPQAHTCSLCEHNAFGSAPGTGKGKACSDDKRLAIVPLQDLENEFYGGPMLLRIPADSLQPLEEYSGKLKKAGAPYYGVATRIRFDPDKKHQRLLMNPIRALVREEVDIILAMRDDPRTERILNSVKEAQVTSEGNSSEPFYEQAEAQAPAPQQPPRRPAPVQPAPGAAPAPQKPAVQAARAPAATTPPPTQPRPAQQAPKPAQAPPNPAPIPASAQAPKPTGGFVARAPGTATLPSPVPQQRAAGGFARPTNPPAPQAPKPAPTTIAAAMAQPAPRPPTQRVVQQAPVIAPPPPPFEAEQQPVDDLDEYGNPAGTVYVEEGQQPEGEYVEEAPLPDGLDEKLNALLGV